MSDWRDPHAPWPGKVTKAVGKAGIEEAKRILAEAKRPEPRRSLPKVEIPTEATRCPHPQWAETEPGWACTACGQIEEAPID